MVDIAVTDVPCVALSVRLLSGKPRGGISGSCGMHTFSLVMLMYARRGVACKAGSRASLVALSFTVLASSAED